MTTTAPQTPLSRVAGFCLIVVAVVICLPFALVARVCGLVYGLALQCLIWLVWCPRGKRVLLVYSESPHWQDYILTELRPCLPESTETLNWSHSKQWNRWSLAVLAFHYFGGARDFNPMVIVFRPMRWAKTFRFWNAFREFRHGKPNSIRTVLTELSGTLHTELPAPVDLGEC